MLIVTSGSACCAEEDGEGEEGAGSSEGAELMSEALDILEQARVMLAEADAKVPRCSFCPPGP